MILKTKTRKAQIPHHCIELAEALGLGKITPEVTEAIFDRLRSYGLLIPHTAEHPPGTVLCSVWVGICGAQRGSCSDMHRNTAVCPHLQ